MGAQVDWGVFWYWVIGAAAVFLVLLGLAFLAREYVKRYVWHLRCRRYWRLHPAYEPRHWEGRPQRRRAR